MKLKMSGGRGRPCLVPDLRGEASTSSPLGTMSAAGFLETVFITLICANASGWGLSHPCVPANTCISPLRLLSGLGSRVSLWTPDSAPLPGRSLLPHRFTQTEWILLAWTVRTLAPREVASSPLPQQIWFLARGNKALKLNIHLIFKATAVIFDQEGSPVFGDDLFLTVKRENHGQHALLLTRDLWASKLCFPVGLGTVPLCASSRM